MKAALKIEWIPDDFYNFYRRLHKKSCDAQKSMHPGEMPDPCYVYKIVSINLDGTYNYKNVPHRKDCSRANNSGTRGVYRWYILESRSVYEVRAARNWNKYQTYYCMVDDDGEIIKIGIDEVHQWLKNIC